MRQTRHTYDKYIIQQTVVHTLAHLAHTKIAALTSSCLVCKTPTWCTALLHPPLCFHLCLARHTTAPRSALLWTAAIHPCWCGGAVQTPRGLGGLVQAGVPHSLPLAVQRDAWLCFCVLDVDGTRQMCYTGDICGTLVHIPTQDIVHTIMMGWPFPLCCGWSCVIIATPIMPHRPFIIINLCIGEQVQGLGGCVRSCWLFSPLFQHPNTVALPFPPSKDSTGPFPTHTTHTYHPHIPPTHTMYL